MKVNGLPGLVERYPHADRLEGEEWRLPVVDRSEGAGRVVLAVVQGNEIDGRIVSMACRVAQKQGARLIALYPREDPQTPGTSALDDGMESRATAVLSAAEQIAKEEGCALEGRFLSTRDAVVGILDEAAEWAAAVIVIAKPFPTSRGDAASYLLETALCSVLVLRP